MIQQLVIKQLMGTGIPKPLCVFYLFIFFYLLLFLSVYLSFIVELCIERYTWFCNLQLHRELPFLPWLRNWHRHSDTCNWIGNAWIVVFSFQTSFNLIWKISVLKSNLLAEIFLYCGRILKLKRTHTLHNICRVCLYSLRHAWTVVKKIHYIMIWYIYIVCYAIVEEIKTNRRQCIVTAYPTE